MPDPANLERAKLIELDAAFSKILAGGMAVTVQFNPETLKVTFANQIVQSSGAGDQRGTPARQFVGAGTTKLALQLWFDVTANEDLGDRADVRELTKGVAYFITPKPLPPGAKPPKSASGDGPSQPVFAPPAVRFAWGSFRFDGIVESFEETLEFWSRDGRPLRAGVSLTLSAQRILFAFNPLAQRAPRDRRPPVGTTPLEPPPPAPKSLPQTVDAKGRGADWQQVALANGIEDALRLEPGRRIDLSARAEGT